MLGVTIETRTLNAIIPCSMAIRIINYSRSVKLLDDKIESKDLEVKKTIAEFIATQTKDNI